MTIDGDFEPVTIDGGVFDPVGLGVVFQRICRKNLTLEAVTLVSGLTTNGS